MATTDGEIDDSLYSRQRCVLGEEAMRRMSHSKVMLCGLEAVGIEIAKNLVLGGVREVIIQDNALCTTSDVGVQFFIREEDVLNGRTRAEASLPHLVSLNPYVRVSLETTDITAITSPFSNEENQQLLQPLLDVHGTNSVKVECLILTRCSLRAATLLNLFCRKHSIRFIYTNVFGVMGNLFCDFGPEFTIFDPNGEPPKEFFVGHMDRLDSQQLLVKVFGDRRHNLDSGDIVRFQDVGGLTELNGQMFPINVTSPTEFTITARTEINSSYTGGGIARQVIQSRLQHFDTLMEQLRNPKIVTTDLACSDEEGFLMHLFFLTLMKFQQEEGRVPKAWDQGDWITFSTKFETLNSLFPHKINQPNMEFIHRLLLVSEGQLAPLCAFFGGVAAQESMKALTGCFTPFHQWLYVHCESVVPTVSDCPVSVTDACSSNSSLAICIGSENVKRLQQLSAFMVGCGAIGCELLKNLALLGVATAQPQPEAKDAEKASTASGAGPSPLCTENTLPLPADSQLVNPLSFSDQRDSKRLKQEFKDPMTSASGDHKDSLLSNIDSPIDPGESVLTQSISPPTLLITDPDHIEKSNLNRQFLFHSKHIGMAKSRVAAEAARQINPAMRIRAMEEKVWPMNEKSVFTDTFLLNLLRPATDNACPGIVLAALDCVPSRRYLDSRCVSLHLPLLESGTLGTKGHVQVILPRLTESYNSQRDDDTSGADEAESIPYCTLKSFPSLSIHCIEWAREKFASQFSLKPERLSQLLTALDRSKPGLQLSFLSNCLLQRSTAEADHTFTAAERESKTRWLSGQLNVSLARFLASRPTDWQGCVRLARDKFERYFNHKARQLLHSFPPETKLADGTPFWQLPKRQPTPVVFQTDDVLHQSFVLSYARLLADQLGIDYPPDLVHSNNDALTSHLDACLSGHNPPSFVPSNKRIVTDENEAPADSMVEPVNPTESGEISNLDEHTVEALRLTVSALHDPAKVRSIYACRSVSFEKDDDSLAHVDFISAAANLRALMYGLPQTPRHEVRRIAGRIVPAIATTTAAVAGLVSLELVKYVCGQNKASPATPISIARNAFLNLALPMILLSEPGPCSKIQLPNQTEFTLWDRWMLEPSKRLSDYLLVDFLSQLKNQYGVDAVVVTQGTRMVYISYMPGHAARLVKPLLSLLSIDHGDLYVDLSVAYDPGPEASMNADYIQGPPVRIQLDRKD